MSFRFDSSDESSSSSEDLTDSSNSSSDDTEDSECPVFREPVAKRAKRDSDSDFKETELTQELILYANYTWIVKDFNKFYKDCKTGDKLESPIFTIGSNQDCLKWRLQIYPKGSSESKNEKDKQFISIYLHLVSSKESKVKVNYVITLPKCSSSSNTTHKGEEHFAPGQQFGFKRFMKSDVLFKYHFLDNGRLTVICNLNVNVNGASSNKLKVVEDLESLLEDDTYCDAVLDVEGQKLSVHKYILAARSPVFAAMFQHDMKEKKENVVEVPDINHSVMKELLRFAYTGSVQNIDATAKDLLAAADKYAFEDLKIMCEEALFKNLSVQNVVEILHFAELHSAAKLKEQALDFAVANVKEVLKTANFKAMAEKEPVFGQIICKMASLPRK